MQQTRRMSTLRLRWLALRARWSIPSMLAAYDEQRIVAFLAALNGGVTILIVGFIAWLTDLPLIFPALGPTAFTLSVKPFAQAAAPRSVILGHFTGIGCGLAGREVSLFLGASGAASTAGEWAPLIGASLALAGTCLLLVRIRCPHAPACASALIVALGAVADIRGVAAMAIAVVVITLQVVCLTRLTGVNMPTWAPREDDGH